MGRLCERQESPEATRIRETCGSSKSAYEEALSRSSLTCAPGEPGILRWTPDESTPDTVFYQVRMEALYLRTLQRLTLPEKSPLLTTMSNS